MTIGSDRSVDETERERLSRKMAIGAGPNVGTSPVGLRSKAFWDDLPVWQVRIFGQATKGVRWMPWHRKAMKDVVSCDKLRLGANNL